MSGRISYSDVEMRLLQGRLEAPQQEVLQVRQREERLVLQPESMHPRGPQHVW